MEYDICEKTGKRCYSKKEANNVIHAAKRKSAKKRIPLRSYYCTKCRTYHLTHFSYYQQNNERTTLTWYKKTKENYKNHIGEEEL